MAWLPKQNVVVPIDFSEASNDAIQTALDIAAGPQHVHVVHVAVMPDFIPYGESLWTVEPEHWLQVAQKHLADYLAAHPEFAGVASHTLEGYPGHRIAEFAARIKADLIVMPSHGYHGFKRMMLGSITETVLRHATCQVLVLRRPE